VLLGEQVLDGLRFRWLLLGHDFELFYILFVRHDFFLCVER
jgi:hypothetical protein